MKTTNKYGCPFFLNADVEAECRKNIYLWSAMREEIGDYDDTIDPLHQKNWVESRKVYEKAALETVIVKREKYLSEWNT